jgi:hypothetical protein
LEIDMNKLTGSCLFFLPLLAASCGGGGTSAGAGSVNSSDVAVYLDMQVAGGLHTYRELGEARVLQVTDPTTGNVLTLSGTRNGAGGLVTAQHATILSSGVTTDIAYINSTDRKIVVGTAASIELTNQPGGVWSIKYTDLVSGDSLSTSLPAAVPVGSAKSEILSTSPDGSTTDNQIPITVVTKSCGTLKDAGTVGVTLNGSSGSYLGSYGATRTGLGQYIAYVPKLDVKGPVSLDFVKEVLESSDKVVGVLCDADKLSPFAGVAVCSTLTALSLKVAPGMASTILKTCEAGVVALKASCAIKEHTSLPIPDYVDPASKDIAKELADIVIDAIPDSINNTVAGYIEAIPQNVTGPSVNVDQTSTSISLEVDDDSPNIGDIVVTPEHPLSDMSYTASAALQCIPFSSSATLAVNGSDGYTNSISKSFPSNAASDSISLTIPGGNTGVGDQLKVVFQARTLSVPITRTAYLVFE